MDKSLWKNKSFLLYLLGQAISALGDGLYLIAFMWFALELSNGKGVVVGGIFSIYTLNEVVFGFIAGPIADRFNKKKLLVIIDILRGIIILLFFIMTKYGKISIFHLYAVTFVFSILSPFFHRTEFAIVPQLLFKSNLLKANGFLGGTRRIVQIVSPGLGGILISILGIETCFFLDSATFFISAVCIMFVRARHSVLSSTRVRLYTLLHDIRNGWKYLLKSKFLFTIGLYAACINFFAGPILPLLAILSAKYSSGSFGYGIIMSAISMGLIISNYGIGFIDKRIKKIHLMLIGLLISAVSIIMFGVMSGLFTIIAIAFLFGIGLSASNLPITVLIQQHTPEEKIGTVSSFVFSLSQIAQPISIALGGFLASIISLNAIFILIGIILCSSALVGYMLPQLKQSDSRHNEHLIANYD